MDRRWADLARTLQTLGWWQHLPAAQAAAGERAVAQGAHPLGGLATLDEEPGPRWCDIDGETWLLDPRTAAAITKSNLLAEHEIPALAAPIPGLPDAPIR